MKIAYLILYTEKNYEEITENLDKILDAGDDAYVMINNDDFRDEVFLVYADEYKEELNKIENIIKEILEEMDSAADYANRLEFENRKDYAVFVLTFPKYIQQYLLF